MLNTRSRSWIGRITAAAMLLNSLAPAFASVADETKVVEIPATVAKGVPTMEARAGTPPPPLRPLIRRLDRGTLLNEVGRLARPITANQVAVWREELRRGARGERAQWLRLWLAEVDMGRQEPDAAIARLKEIQKTTSPDSAVHGLARYDEAVARFYAGMYEQARDSFRALLKSKHVGFDRANASLWLRHAIACAGYHEANGRLGIVQPPRLDPLCGVAAVAQAAKALGLPHDEARMSEVVPHTGEGSSMEDLIVGAERLGLRAYPISADEHALRALPKPLVAHVERDHFVSVIKADDAGVVYACSDCGRWPGGLQRVTWKQWRAMAPGAYLAIVQPRSAEDIALDKLAPRKRTTPTSDPTTVAMVRWMTSPQGTTMQAATAARHLISALSGHIATWLPTLFLVCGQKPESLHCPPDCLTTACPLDASGSAAGGGLGGAVGGTLAAMAGPSAGDPVNLATGEEEYSAPMDLEVYNPTGPSIVWRRVYNSLGNYNSSFGQSWSHPYNVGVLLYDEMVDGGGHVPGDGGGTTGSSTTGSTTGSTTSTTTGTTATPTGSTTGSTTDPGPGTGTPGTPGTGTFTSGKKGSVQRTSGGGAQRNSFNGGTNPATASYRGEIVLSNGARIKFQPTGSNVPSSTTPVVDCTVAPGVPLIVKWRYDAATSGNYVEVTFRDRSRWVTGGNTPSRFRPIKRMYDRNGNFIQLNHASYNTDYEVVERLTSIADQNGQALLTLGLDAKGNAVSATDRYGRSVYYTVQRFNTAAASPWRTFYDQVTQVSQIVPTGTANPAIRFAYTYQLENGGHNYVPFLKTIGVPSPTGTGTATSTLEYNTSLATVTALVDANGNRREYTEGTKTVTSPHGPSASVTDPNTTVVTVKDPLGNVVHKYSVTFDQNMNPTVYKNALGQVVRTLAYTDADNPFRASSITDGNNRTWTYNWDNKGNLLSYTTPRGTTTTNTWDYVAFPLGQLSATQEGTKTPTTFAYTSLGQIQQVTTPTPGTNGSPSSQTTSITYTPLGSVASISFAGNNAVTSRSVTFNYTTDGTYTQTEMKDRPIRVTNSGGKAMHFRYDARGNQTSSADPDGIAILNQYNLANQVTQTQLASSTGTGTITATGGYLYPGGPKTFERVYNESNTLIRQKTFTYGKEGELLTSSGGAEDASLTYRADYKVLTFKDGRNGTTTYAYDQVGNLTSITFPGGTGTNYDKIQYPSYDAVGNALQRVDGRGVVTNYAYTDADGLLTAATYPATPAQDVSISYDAYGRPASLTDGAGSATTSYDDLGNVTSATRTYTGLPAQTFTYTYHPDGSRKTMTNAAGTWTYDYDAAGRCVSMASPAGTTQWTYTDGNRVVQRTLPNGARTINTYNAAGLLQSLVNEKANGTALSSFTNLQYDGAYARTGFTANYAGAAALSGTTTYSYDSRARLLQEASTRGTGYTNVFGYDGSGNPTTFRGGAQTFNADNQRSGAGYTYDGNGNPTVYAGTNLTWDVENRLTAAGAMLTAGYRGDGLRAWKQSTAGRTYFAYDEGNPVLELNASGAVTAVNVFGPDGLVARKVGSATTQYAFDPQGNVATRLDGAANVVNNAAYDAYGIETVAGTAANDPFGYNAKAGYYLDRETGLYLCQRRYYDPAAGRWLNRDPSQYAGGVNLYAYCANRPVQLTDSTGLDAMQDALKEAAKLWPALGKLPLGFWTGLLSGIAGCLGEAASSGLSCETAAKCVAGILEVGLTAALVELGALTGGAIGSIFPGPGNIIGAIIGGIGGGALAKYLANKMSDTFIEIYCKDPCKSPGTPGAPGGSGGGPGGGPGGGFPNPYPVPRPIWV